MSDDGNSRVYLVVLSSLPREEFEAIREKLKSWSFMCKDVEGEHQMLFVHWDRKTPIESFVNLPPGSLRPWAGT